MTTYNTYQEAKIAHPESEIYFIDNEQYRTGEWIDQYNFGRSSFVLCDPADHCMTVEKFLVDGHEVFMGDAIININGNVNYITKGDAKVINSEGGATFNNARYILRAAALEDIPTETPEEKEVLDSIESAGEVEWKGGDKPKSGQDVFIAQMNTLSGVESKRYFIHQYWCNSNHQNQLLDLGILFTDSDSATSKTKSLLGIDEEAPETPQQREDRERLEAAYDLYEEAQHAIGCIGYDDFDFFKKSDIQVKFWLAIVDKTNYRKEKTHGTN